MPIRLSSLFLRTLREDPSDAEVESHRLLVRAGYIRRAAPGIFTWLPLGLRVKANIERIVREEMERAGAQEVFFPALLPKEPYEATGRWEEYGDNIFRLQDRKKADYLLAPTHEEVFTLLVKDMYSSYKDLPLAIYQIQNKYRDEARPRAGLLRGREFVMKDAYSFDVTDEGLAKSYQAQRDAYERIFQRLGVEYVVVKADAGAMGGSKSEEFLSPSPIGEDTFVRSAGGFAANVEAVSFAPAPEVDASNNPAPQIFDSPNTPTIATLVDFANQNHPGARPFTAADTLKNVVLALISPDGKRELVVVGLPGDREVDQKRAEACFGPNEVEAANESDFAKYPQLVKGYIGPVQDGKQFLGKEGISGIRYLLDPRVAKGSMWITGANLDQKHIFNLTYGRDFEADGIADIAEIRAGDPAPDGSGELELARGIEIGHVFQLGRKYAEALDLKVLDENGKLVTVTMGSYGIGVTRLVAVLAEANRDDSGLIWPEAVSPADVHIIAAGKDEEPFQAAEMLTQQAESKGLSVLLDDRQKVSPGVKFADAELIGVPWVIICGRGVAEGQVELWNRRSGERVQVGLESAIEELTARRS
ncbi:proline--tRNA ligase [Aquiluna sp. KACHI24]|uniref:proline--tRNA ligase n=1 Tax=Aquiluna sp. KACHI24 TaxID=2968831 RepID=UPI002204EADD|nr:proline--tRNA ligase [Aquiluna sp. KACHI24]BDQ00081.1 proline--tRNA ligase [Aquiluna sp. KACHI24]